MALQVEPACARTHARTHACAPTQVEPNFDLMDDAHNWRDMTAADASGPVGDAETDPLVAELPTDADVASASALPLNADGTLDFFWLDACEVQGSKGNIYLFGKASAHAQPRPCPRPVAHVHLAHSTHRIMRWFHTPALLQRAKPLAPPEPVFSRACA